MGREREEDEGGCEGEEGEFFHEVSFLLEDFFWKRSVLEGFSLS